MNKLIFLLGFIATTFLIQVDAAELSPQKTVKSSEINFKGVALGVPIKTFMKQFGKKGYRCVADPDNLSATTCESTSDTYAGKKADLISATFIDNKLGIVKIQFIEKNEEILQYEFTYLFNALKNNMYPELSNPVDEVNSAAYGFWRESKFSNGYAKILISLQIPQGMALKMGDKPSVNIEMYSNSYVKDSRKSYDDANEKRVKKDM